MQHLNFCELDKLEGKMRAVNEAKINKMRAEKSASNKYDKEQENGDLCTALVWNFGFIYNTKLNFTWICYATKIRYMPKKL